MSIYLIDYSSGTCIHEWLSHASFALMMLYLNESCFIAILLAIVVENSTGRFIGEPRFENPAFATFLIIRITYAGSRQIEREPASKLRVQPVMAET